MWHQNFIRKKLVVLVDPSHSQGQQILDFFPRKNLNSHRSWVNHSASQTLSDSSKLAGSDPMRGLLHDIWSENPKWYFKISGSKTTCCLTGRAYRGYFLWSSAIKETHHHSCGERPSVCQIHNRTWNFERKRGAKHTCARKLYSPEL